MSPITIDHHRAATAACQGCAATWATDDHTLVSAVLARGAEHAIVTGHTVAEHVTDDATVRPLETEGKLNA